MSSTNSLDEIGYNINICKGIGEIDEKYITELLNPKPKYKIFCW